MSSLMQHHGGRSKDGRKVELLMYLVKKGPEWDRYNGPDSSSPSPQSTTFTEDAEQVMLTRPNGKQTACAKLYRIYRRPAGMLGCWVQFRYNGATHAPDLSVPIAVFVLPKGATPLSEEEMTAYWFS